MSMKLQFEFDVKKADDLLRTLNEIKKGFGDIDQTKSSFSKQLIQGIQTSSEQMQKLKDAMQMGSSGAGGKGLEDFVRLSEKAFGIQMRTLIDAQAKSMEGLKKEINGTIENMNTLTKTIERLERQESTMENRKRIRAAETRLVQEGVRLDQQQQLFSQAQAGMMPQEETPATGRMRQLYGAADARFQGAIGRAGGMIKAAGGIAAGVMIGGQALGMPAELGQQAYTARLRSEADLLRLQEEAGRDAMRGDLGRAVIRQFGEGGRILGGDLTTTEKMGAMGATVTGFGTDVLRATGVGKLLGMAGINIGDYRGFSPETYTRDFLTKRAKTMEASEIQRYGEYINQASQFQFKAGDMIGGYEAFAGGPEAAQQALQSALMGGVSLQHAAPMMNMMARFGLGAGGRGRDMGARLQFGADDLFSQQILRRQAFGMSQTGVVGGFGGLLGAAGLAGNTGLVREQISGDVGRFLSRQDASVTMESVTGMLGANIGAGVGAGVAGGMTTEAASEVATRSTLMQAERLQGGGSYESMLVREKLRNMGLSLPAIQRLMELVPGSGAFFKALVSFTGRPEEQLRREFGSTVGAFESTLKGMTAMSKKELRSLISSGAMKGVTTEQLDSMTEEQVQDVSYRISQAGLGGFQAFRTAEETFTTPGVAGAAAEGPITPRRTTVTERSEAEAALELRLSQLATDLKVLDQLKPAVEEFATSVMNAATEINKKLEEIKGGGAGGTDKPEVRISPEDIDRLSESFKTGNFGSPMSPAHPNTPINPISTPATENKKFYTPRE